MQLYNHGGGICTFPCCIGLGYFFISGEAQGFKILQDSVNRCVEAKASHMIDNKPLGKIQVLRSFGCRFETSPYDS